MTVIRDTGPRDLRRYALPDGQLACLSAIRAVGGKIRPDSPTTRTKSIVVASSLAGRSYSEFEQGLLHRHRTRGQATLRAANAALALASGAVLVTYLLHG